MTDKRFLSGAKIPVNKYFYNLQMKYCHYLIIKAVKSDARRCLISKGDVTAIAALV